MREWSHKGKPYVWDDIAEKTFSKKWKYIRLWTHKCGQHLIKGDIWRTNIHSTETNSISG